MQWSFHHTVKSECLSVSESTGLFHNANQNVPKMLFISKSVPSFKKNSSKFHLVAAWSRNDCFTSFQRTEWNMWWNEHRATPSSTTDPNSNCKQGTTPGTQGNTECTRVWSHQKQWLWRNGSAKTAEKGIKRTKIVCLPWQFAAVQYSAWWTLPYSEREKQKGTY